MLKYLPQTGWSMYLISDNFNATIPFYVIKAMTLTKSENK